MPPTFTFTFTFPFLDVNDVSKNRDTLPVSPATEEFLQEREEEEEEEEVVVLLTAYNK